MAAYNFLQKKAWDILEMVSSPCLASESDVYAINRYLHDCMTGKDSEYAEIAQKVVDLILSELKERYLA